MTGGRSRTQQNLSYEILSGKRPSPVGAALGYVDDLLLTQDHSLTPHTVKAAFLEGLPFVSSLVTTPLGPLITVILPRFQSEVFDDEAQLLDEIKEALHLCGKLSVRVVSLTGLIPSATLNGTKLVEHLRGAEGLPQPTTGHATTTACIALNIDKMLQEAGRDLAGEDVAFVGLGSVGVASLRLTLSVLPHMRSLVLADVYAKKGHLEELAEECRAELGYSGDITTATARSGVADEVYKCRTIIAATNVGSILDVARLLPGTVIIDDSAPHVFDVAHFWRRFEETGDILATEGGPLRFGEELTEVSYLPARWAVGDPEGFAAGNKKDPCEMMGCTLSSVLTALDPVGLPPQIGGVDLEEAVKHYHRLQELGCQGCTLNIDEVPLPPDTIRSFRSRFGSGHQ